MCVCAVVLVGVMLVLRRPWGVLRGRWVHCAVAGVLVNAILLMTAHVAMTRVPAAPIALIQTLNPLLTAALAWPVLGERLRARQWLGLLLGAAGVVLIVGPAALHSTVELRLLLLTVSWRNRAVLRHAVFRPVLPRRADAGGHDGAIPGRVGSLACWGWRCSRRRTPTGPVGAIVWRAVECGGRIAGRDGAVSV